MDLRNDDLDLIEGFRRCYAKQVVRHLWPVGIMKIMVMREYRSRRPGNRAGVAEYGQRRRLCGNRQMIQPTIVAYQQFACL